MGGSTACRACHGTDYRGTVLSQVKGSRSFTVDGAPQTFFPGATIGCYTCHQGPFIDPMNKDAAPIVNDVSVQTTAGVPVVIVLPGTGINAAIRIISQPANGSVGLSNNIATYFPFDGFTGTDTFTFAAYDGAKNSGLATGTISVAPNAVPSAPTAISPAGSGISTTPAFTFNAVAGATGYSVRTQDYSTASSWTTNITPLLAGCSSGAGRCSFTMPTHLAQHSYSWFVAASNHVGMGPWSNSVDFTVDTITPAPTAISPTRGGISTTPAFTFNAVAGATGYSVWTQDYTTAS